MSDSAEMRILAKSRIAAFLDGLLETRLVYAPVAAGGTLGFDRITSGSEAVTEFGNTVASPRHLLMPRTETLLSCPAGGGPPVAPGLEEPSPPAVLFGVRPCDARALLFLDRVLGGGREKDVYYLRRRESLAVVSIGCTDPAETCFCTTVGGGPLSSEGSDLLLEDCGDSYRVHVLTDRGKVLADGLDRHPGGSAVDAALPAPRDLPAISPPIDLAKLKEVLDRSFDDPLWDDLARRCLGCGICSFLCPSCHCFDIIDEDEGGVRSRRRIWDTCQFAGFTEQASGFNPRPDGTSRHRQRVMHKFSWCVDSYGMPGCTGCGRCIRECPVNLDIRSILSSFHSSGGQG